jgi:hypothetical protein
LEISWIPYGQKIGPSLCTPTHLFVFQLNRLKRAKPKNGKTIE